MKWCLSFLGAEDAKENKWFGITKDSLHLYLDVNKIEFSDQAKSHLAKLNGKLKETEEYQKTGAIDLGRYMALTIGSSYHYYKIAEVPKKLEDLKTAYTFDTIQGYINNSGVSKVHRIIDYAQNMALNNQAYISTEIDTLTGKALEFETVEVMPNGLSRFGLYDLEGNLKDVADPEFTKAGKVGKCMWCHETVIQPLFRIQLDIPEYLTYQQFGDTLTKYALELRAYQKANWKDNELLDKRNNTNMELSYISFMEPSLYRLSNEWGISIAEVRKKVVGLPTHRHNEHKFLGELYDRANIDKIAPWSALEVPESIREKSLNELDLLSSH